MSEKTDPVVGERGGCGVTIQVVDYFGDCACRTCATADAEERPMPPSDADRPPLRPESCVRLPTAGSAVEMRGLVDAARTASEIPLGNRQAIREAAALSSRRPDPRSS